MSENNIYQKEDLDSALEVLRNGGVIIYPTETVWGIGCDATNAEAIARISNIKKRNDSRAMISLVSNEVMLERYANDIPEIAFELIEATVDPLTIVLDHPKGIAPLLLDSDGSAAFRIAATGFCQDLVKRLGRPLVSTSANLSGCPTPVKFEEIDENLLKEVDYVVEYGREEKGTGKPSSIIKISDGGVIKIIRQ